MLWLAASTVGLAACLTLLFLGMRAVMQIGGACADGGPYVPVQPCPEGSPAAMLLGILGLFGFGAPGMVAGARIGGGWAALPLLGWPALFGSLGFNFLDYGLLNPPEGEGIVWGWLIPGVMFELMAFGPLAFVLAGRRAVPGRLAATVPRTTGQPLRPPGTPAPGAAAPTPPPAGEPAGSRPSGAEPARLRGIAAPMGAAATRTRTRDRAASPSPSANDPELAEGTRDLLDRLERLADLRDRGLLDPAEYATAKEAVMRELEARR